MVTCYQGRARDRQRGFTLIELIAALAVIGIVLGMVVVSVGGFSVEARWDAARARIAGAAKLARTRAASEGRPLLLLYDLEQSSVAIGDRKQSRDRAVGHAMGPRVRIEAVRTGLDDVGLESIVRVPVIGVGMIAPHVVYLVDHQGTRRIVYVDHFGSATYVNKEQIDELFARKSDDE